MSGNKRIPAFATLVVLMLASVTLLFGQGVGRQVYSGLDKYNEQGRADQSSFVGVRAAEFLSIPIGARGIALGSAYTAVADDISAIWWNPAGLGFLENREVMVSVVDYTMDLTYSFGAAAAPIGDGVFVVGGFFGYLDVPETEVTTITNPNGTGQVYSAYDFQMGGTLACNLSDRFSCGFNLKYVHQDVFNNIGGDAFAIDAGGLYHTELLGKGVRFAFSIQNLGTNITMQGPNLIYEAGPQSLDGLLPDGYNDYSSDINAISRRANRQVQFTTHTYRLPTMVKMGLAYNLFTREKSNLLVSGELWRPSNSPIGYAAGSELNYNFDRNISGALRVGWEVQRDEFTDDVDNMGLSYYGDDPTWRGFSMGGGIARSFAGKTLRFDYAYRNKGRLSADNFISVAFTF